MAVNFYSETHFADNVGIGTASPGAKLHVQGATIIDGFTTGSSVALNVGGSNNAQIRARHIEGKDYDSADYGVLHLNYYTSENVSIAAGGGNILTGSGNVGVGTSSPGQKLEVSGNAVVSGNMMLGSSASGEYITRTGSPYRLGLFTNSAERISVTNGGNVGIGTSSPGEKLDVAGDIKLSGDIELGHASDTTIARASAGKVTIEGQPIQTKQMSMTHHNFFMNSSSTSADFFIPFNNLNESSNPTNSIYYGRMVAPYDGRIVKVVLNTTAAIGTSCQVLFWIANSISGVFAPSASETVTGVNLNTANSHAVATFSTNSTAEFNEGDVLGVSIIKSSSSTANMQVTVVWEYTV